MLGLGACRRLTFDRLSTTEFINMCKKSTDPIFAQLASIVEREMKNHSKLRVFASPTAVEQLAKGE